MFSVIKLQASPCYAHNISRNSLPRRPSHLNVPLLGFSSVSLRTHNAASTSESSPRRFTSAVGSPPSLHLSHWNLTHRHILILNVMACAAALSTTWLFFSAIPNLLAFKKAAESMEKLLDATREELPDTMAAVRLSGMEISDLTMELSDLGQEITQGVRRSTRAVRLAEDGLRQLTNINTTALVQEVADPMTKRAEPALAKTARKLREGIVEGQTILQIFFTVIRFSRLTLNYFAARGQKKQ